MKDKIRRSFGLCVLIIKTVALYALSFLVTLAAAAQLPNSTAIEPDGTEALKGGYVILTLVLPLLICILFYRKQRSKVGALNHAGSEPAPGPVHVLPKSAEKSCYVVFDIETTGLSRTDDRIIEIAANKYSDDVLVDKYHTYINPGFHIPATVTRLTGISDETVADAPSIKEVKDSFLSFIGNAPLVGHNIAVFDIPFIQAQMGVTLCNTLHDTLRISHQVFPGLPSYKLSYLDQALRLGGKEHHRAANDVAVNNALFLACNDPKPYKHILKDKKALANIEIEPRRMSLLYDNIDIHAITPSCKRVCQTGLTGKCVVFTGEIVMPRREAMQKAVDAGAILKRDVSNKVDYLIVGTQDLRLAGPSGRSQKQRYADELIAKGNHKLKVIGEAEFLELLKPIN